MHYSGVDEKKKGRVDELEKANASLRREIGMLNEVLDSLPDLMFEIDGEGTIEAYRARVKEELYAHPDAFLGRKVRDVLPEEAALAIETALRDASERGYHHGTVYPLEMPGGERWFELSLAGKPGGEGREKRFVALVRNVTGRRHVEDLLKEELLRKERLLREIHHRLNNNLQAVSNLLAIQEQQIGDPVCRSTFSESRDRIRSIARIHELLYRSRDAASVDFRSYLSDIMPVLLELYGRREITYVLDLKEIHLPEEIAVPLALMVNELVSNAFTHAFPGGREGTIFVGLQAPAPSSLLLTIRDNGVGFPECSDFSDCASLGLKLVEGFAEQIDAVMEMGRNGGTSFAIRLDSIE